MFSASNSAYNSRCFKRNFYKVFIYMVIKNVICRCINVMQTFIKIFQMWVVNKNMRGDGKDFDPIIINYI